MQKRRQREREEGLFNSRFSVPRTVRMLLVDDDGRCRDGLVKPRELGQEVGRLASRGCPEKFKSLNHDCTSGVFNFVPGLVDRLGRLEHASVVVHNPCGRALSGPVSDCNARRGPLTALVR